MADYFIDIHTHIYPPAYLKLLRSRQRVPYLHDDPSSSNAPPRLIILPSDDDPKLPISQRGRPIDGTYSSIEEKIRFMDHHKITTSIISLANPWLDFLAPEEGPPWAQKINDELNTICTDSQGRLHAFGALPLSSNPEAIITQINRLRSLPHLKGVIMGTSGLNTGAGMDDPNLDPIYAALEATNTLIFLHPHYGLPSDVFGPRAAADYGHVLPLALGFPMETTITFTRMYLSGIFDRFPGLKILLAHAGGATPFLAGRIESCIRHERHFLDDSASGPEAGGESRAPKRKLNEVLRTNVWLDAVTYSAAGVKAAVDVVGVERVLFGTDHPFFPPLDRALDEEWESVRTNVDAALEAYPVPGVDGKEVCQKILAGNARALFKLGK